jgi:nucleoside-triphosphatase
MSPSSARTLLLTGPPRVGKSTLIRRVANALCDWRIRGFITDEIREAGRRVGFQLNTFDGRSLVIAHEGIHSRHRVGKYGVDVEALEGVATSALHPDEGVDVYLVDEIGPMECLSQAFVAAVRELLDSDCKTVATIHRSTGGFIGEVKRRPDVELRQVTSHNRDEMLEDVLEWIRPH